MKKEFYEQTAAVEDRHWYMLGRRDLVRALLRRARFRGKDALEVGCGSGGNLPLLAEWCAQVTGLDLSPVALAIARRKAARGTRLVRGDATRPPFKAGSFDLVADFNMLYHRWVKDDAATLATWAALLRPGGTLVLFEPAFMALWRHHDEVDMGRVRYRLPQVTGWLRAAGLEVRTASYFNGWAFFPALALAFLEKLFPPAAGNDTIAELSLPPAPVNRFIRLILALENWLIRTCGRLPLGTTLVCVAVKKAGVRS